MCGNDQWPSAVTQSQQLQGLPKWSIGKRCPRNMQRIGWELATPEWTLSKSNVALRSTILAARAGQKLLSSMQNINGLSGTTLEILFVRFETTADYDVLSRPWNACIQWELKIKQARQEQQKTRDRKIFPEIHLNCEIILIFWRCFAKTLATLLSNEASDGVICNCSSWNPLLLLSGWIKAGLLYSSRRRTQKRVRSQDLCCMALGANILVMRFWPHFVNFWFS